MILVKAVNITFTMMIVMKMLVLVSMVVMIEETCYSANAMQLTFTLIMTTTETSDYV